MPDPATDRLPDWVREAAADPRLTVLWTALARRYGEGGRPTRSVTVRDMDDDQRAALAELLRLPTVPPSTTQVRVDKVAHAYGITEEALRLLVIERCGPVGDRAEARVTARSARETAADELVEGAHGAAGPHTWMDANALAGWASGQARALGGDLEHRTAEVAAVLGVLREASPDTPAVLPVVAASSSGDPHALDPDRPRGRILDAALAAAAGALSTDAASRRQRRRRAGLLDDEVSSTTLSWRLPLATTHPLTAAGASYDRAGQAMVWTLAQLRAMPVEVRPSRILVVENPAVLSTAVLRDLWLPVVCTSGVPSVATGVLLDALAADGCHLDVHADFDPAGLQIVASILARIPSARPWLMDAPTYMRHLDVAVERFEEGEAVTCRWDEHLEVAMRTHRLRVFEEQLVDALLTDPLVG